MKKQLQLWKHDFIEGIWNRKVYFLLPIFVALISCISLHAKIEGNIKTGAMTDSGTFMDYWIYFIKGGKAYKFSWYSLFELPVRWMCIQVFLLISLVNYAFYDLHTWGYQVLARSKSRFQWWFSKIVWCTLYAVVFYMVCFLTIALYTAAKGIPFQLLPSREAMAFFAKIKFLACGPKRLFCIVVILPVLLSVFMGLLQMVLSMCIKPVFSFVSVLVLFVISIYWNWGFLPGNWGMPYRIAPIRVKGLAAESCLVLLLCGIVICITAGYWIFKRQDILEKNI